MYPPVASMSPADRQALLGRMKESGGGPVALQMEFYDLLVRVVVPLLERIAHALERLTPRP